MPACTTENTLDRIAERAGKLYSLPAVAVEVLRLTESPQVDVPALKRCLENDPALTTKILRVVNSSIFGIASQVSDLSQALALLGTKPLKLLVLGFSLPTGENTHRRSNRMLDAALNRYWRTTLIKAVAARKLAVSIFEKDGDEAFLASLLEDLGMLVLLEQLGETYADFMNKVRRAGDDLARLERESLGFEHRELTVRLLSVWGLPKALVQSIEVTEDRTDHPPSIARLAELFAELIIDGRPEQLEALRGATASIEALEDDGLMRFVDGLEQQVAELAAALSLDAKAEPDYAHIITQAHSQLAAVASDTVVDMLDNSTADCPVHHLKRQVDELSETVASYANEKSLGIARNHEPHTADSSGVDVLETSDPAVQGRVRTAIAASRRDRTPLSLVIVELKQPAERVLQHGPEVMLNETSSLLEACKRTAPVGSTVLSTRDTGFSLVLPNCDRGQAKELFRQFTRSCVGEVVVCAGIATVALPPKNFSATKLIDAAARCLRAACHSGSSQLKSIEIY